MNKYIQSALLLIMALFLNTSYAQTIDRKVISTSGSVFQSTGVSVSATLGETFTTTLTGGGMMLTQGFQQPELPICTLKINNGADTLYFCGTSGQLVADPSYSSFNWSNGATTATTTVTTSGWYVCTAGRTACSAIDSIYVSFVGINPAPTINGAATICQNTSTTLSISANFNTYLWSNGASTSSITTNTAGNYTVTVTNTFGCSSSATKAVTVVANPAPSISGSFTPCIGSTASLTATSGFSTYQWSTGATTQTINTLNAGSYTVTVTNASGCSGSNTQAVTFNSNPTVTISGPQSACQGNTATLSASSGFTSYLWNTGATSSSINPTASGSYTVTVTNSNGCSGSSTSLFVLNPSSNTTQNVSRCPGDAYTLPSGQIVNTNGTYNSVLSNINGCDSIIVTNITFLDNIAPAVSNTPTAVVTCNPASWTPPSFTDNCSYVVSSNYQPGMNLPLGSTTVTYVATDPSGNSVSTSFNVSVVDSSTAAGSITTNRDYNNICLGQNITLTVNGGNLGDQASWRWYQNACGGATNYVGQGPSITLTPTVTTTYYVRAEGTCNLTACSSINVIVSTTAPTQTPVISTLPTSAAPGVTATVCANPIPDAVYYQWFTLNGQNQAVLFNGQTGPVQSLSNCVNVTFVTAQQNYFIRAFAANACGRTSQTNPNPIRGTVPAPTCINGPTQVCVGQSYSYTACAIPNQTNVTYDWQIIPATPGTATITFNGTFATVNILSGFTTAQLCANGISSFGLPGPSYCITINNNVPAPGPITGNLSPCQGSNQSYSIQSLPNATSYTWSTTVVGAQVNANGTTASVIFPSGNFNGDLCVVASNLCGASTPSCQNIVASLPGNPGPITGPISGVCNASNVNYQLNTSDALGYNWTAPSGATISSQSNLNAVNVNFSSAFTSGTIQVEAIYACGSIYSSILISGAPDSPTITPNTICPNATQQYTLNQGGSTYYSWVITGEDNSVCMDPPNCSQQLITWGPNGGSISVTASNSCGTSSQSILNTSTCKLSEIPFSFKAFPNPNNGNFTIEFNSSNLGTYIIKIQDVSGKCVFIKTIESDEEITNSEIHLEGIEAGIYFIQLIDANGVQHHQKICVQ